VVSELQWIQYMLDTCETVAEVIEMAKTVRIDVNATSKLQYMVGDKGGETTVIEFLEGEMVINQSSSLPIKAMTNSPYQQAVKYRSDGVREFADLYEENSMERFNTVADALPKPETITDCIGGAFRLMDSSRREETVYGIAYDLQSQEMHLLTSNVNNRQKLKVSALNFNPGRQA
jgi:hypothetical protein